MPDQELEWKTCKERIDKKLKALNTFVQLICYTLGTKFYNHFIP